MAAQRGDNIDIQNNNDCQTKPRYHHQGLAANSAHPAHAGIAGALNVSIKGRWGNSIP
jgi:hypothetical protein